eukprot:TRINITY_DN93095_c0_g1_i1.p1 TRINITY_DN93095_c0_g1~~TRINITY_DN93095_c0_g1_i1.p1  ORF type:complete len:573 (+),score=158.93 TRINITY_DN93095_c0_g1_i1:116-1720(+)
MPSQGGSRPNTTQMRKSSSAPKLSMTGTGFAKTLRNRGEHDIGLVAGHSSGDEVYVPRAMWTITADSPMKQASQRWDPHAFMEDEIKRQLHQEGMKAYYQHELAKQMQETYAFKQSMKDGRSDMARAVTADIERQNRVKQVQQAEAMKTRANLRASLDKQVEDLERRAKEARMESLKEGAELKARCMQQLCQELQSQANKKKAMKKDAENMQREIERRAALASNDKKAEAAELRATIKEQTLQEEFRLAAQQDRMSKAQARADASEDIYNKTAGLELSMRNTHELTRQERDVKKHELRSDLHYSRREAARERQRQNMLNTLNMQSSASGNKKELERIGKQKDKEAVDTAVRLSLEADLERARQRKAEEVQRQADLVQMMAEKQKRDREDRDGFKPPAATNTMEVSKSFLQMSMARAASAGALPKSKDLMHQVDASRHLDKPMGRAEVKPWVDIAKSHGLGGVVGVFGGEGHLKLKLAATGGTQRLLTKTAGLAVRDHQMQATWSEGLTSSDMKTGLKAARARQEAQQRDKSDRF